MPQTLRIHYFQHVPFETPGYINEWAQQHQHQQSYTKFFQLDALPGLDALDWLVVMGGPMGVYEKEKYPWLEAEQAFIRQCITAGKTVIGICLGSQLIAASLGTKVYPNTQKEIGWFPVQFTEAGRQSWLLKDLPDNSTVLHWHGDTFDLPESAELLLQTDVCKNQAFLYQKRVLGLQFHFEATESTLREMVENCRHELVAAPYIQTEEQILAGAAHIRANNGWLAGILDQLAFNKA